MKKMFLYVMLSCIIVIIFVTVYYFIYEQEQYLYLSNNPYLEETMPAKDWAAPRLERLATEGRPSNSNPKNIIKVKFGNQFILYWNTNRMTSNYGIIRDENYSAILNNNNSIRSMAYFITNEEIVCNYLCSKESALKKGDIAFKFLSDIEMIGVYSCLGIQFDTAIIPCGLPIGLFNYIENNRNLVFQKVMSCLDKKDAAPSAVRSDK